MAKPGASDEGASLHLEGQSAVDSGWYDCEVRQRGSTLFLRFDGYSSEDEEPLRSLEALRFSSIAADPRDCPAIVPGTRVTGFKRSPAADLWIDAEVVGKRAGRHEGGKCSCSFTVQWLATADAGKRAELRIGDLCRLDTRPLSQHPKYEQYRAVLEKRAAAGTAGGAAARNAAPAPCSGAVAEHSPEAISISDSGDEEPGRAGKQQQGAAPPLQLLLRPPAGASGPPCALCRLPVVVDGDQLLCSEDVRRDFEGKYSQSNVVHKQCAAWAYNSGLRNVAFTKGSQVSAVIRMSFDGGVGEAQTYKCLECGEHGASVRCSATNCRRWFHLPCTSKCKHDPGNCELLCPGHAVLGPTAGMKSSAFYGSRAGRQAELEGMRSGRLRVSGSAVRLGGLKQGGTLERRRGPLGLVEAPRRSVRHAEKRVRYDQQYLESEGVTEGWQKDILRRARRGEDSGDEYGSSEDGGEEGIHYMDHSEDDEPGHRMHGGKARGKQGGRGEQLPQRELRQRKKVKSYAEEQEELELRELAYKQEQRAKTGYEDTRCEVCDSKARGKEMLLCDNPGCDRGYHIFCLDPPLEAAPLAFWYCPDCLPEQDCETCGLAVPGTPAGRKRKGGAGSSGTAQGLSYCSECGALCHGACMKEHEGGPRCELCAAGLRDVEAILGCRPVEARASREYYVKFKDKSYRRCRWVTERAVARAAGDKLQRFMRDTRDAPSVEPNVQQQWLQVERVVAMRDEEEGGQRLCLVKWRGLEYDKATWEPRQELEGSAEGKAALKKFERRMALRVERDAEAEEAARAAQVAPLAKQPPFLRGVGTLKDYQLEGVSWVLAKLRSGMSAILGDEMGLGKTIQTAVFLQMARQLGLTTGPVAVVVPLSTFGSWEREMAKWAPGLEVLSYSGQQEARAMIRKYELGSEEDSLEMARRKLTALKPRFHVMLTTYDVVIRDTAVLRRFDWSAVVIDEGHSLKGQDSQRGKALREMGAPWRLLLTGTPLQNNLRELLALLAFMADCKIEDIERRVNRMADPNPPAPGEVQDADEELLQAQAYIRKLHAYLEPRMLRRMKAVCLAGQMPPKITRRLACRMTPLQRQLYKDILAKEWDRVHAMVKNRLEKKSMNNILIRLRQACCHPYLLPGQEPEEYKETEDPALAEEGWRLMVAASGKLTALQQMLPRLLADGHRVLIFSQSVEMLDILEDFLHDFQDPSGLLPPAEEDEPRSEGSTGTGAADGGSEATASGAASGSVPPEAEHGGEEEDFVRGRRGSVIRYFRLDGKTKGWQRQAMMDSFNSIDCKVKVMLISTRAGSLGINLQTANTVVLYDPDFNPFVDAQAEGRAHRLGQEETVMVYQMYTAHSVEERILEVAAKKRKLEELVTKHLGRSRDISDEDIKSSVLHGWGNIMRQEEEEGRQGGADLRMGEAELAALLDREHVFKDDVASGADAAALLGEVRAGGAAAMRFEAGGGGDEAGVQAEQKAEQDAELAKMMLLIEERRRKFEADRAAQEELGRGRRSRAVAVNYDEKQDGMAELLSDDESPEKSKGKGKLGAKRRRDDDEYDPALSPGFVPPHKDKGSGENAQPNAEGLARADSAGASSSYDPGSSDNDSADSSDDSEVEAERGKARKAAVQQQQAQQAQQAQQVQQVQQVQQQALARPEAQQALALAAQVQAAARRLAVQAVQGLPPDQRAEVVQRALMYAQQTQQPAQPQAQQQVQQQALLRARLLAQQGAQQKAQQKMQEKNLPHHQAPVKAEHNVQQKDSRQQAPVQLQAQEQAQQKDPVQQAQQAQEEAKKKEKKEKQVEHQVQQDSQQAQKKPKKKKEKQVEQQAQQDSQQEQKKAKKKKKKKQVEQQAQQDSQQAEKRQSLDRLFGV